MPFVRWQPLSVEVPTLDATKTLTEAFTFANITHLNFNAERSEEMSQLIEELAQKRRKLKREEELLAEQRKAIDAELAKLLPKPDDGKTASYKFNDGDTTIKVAVEHGTTVKVDTEAVQRDYAKLPVAVQGAFRWKAEVVSASYDKLSVADQRVAAKYVEEKPATPSIKIEVK